jgi:hypothetical protein
LGVDVELKRQIDEFVQSKRKASKEGAADPVAKDTMDE